eukprot:6191824-Pleurochrysis_carterae.AAC.2
MFSTVEQFSNLAEHRVEGMEAVMKEFWAIIDGMKVRRAHCGAGLHLASSFAPPLFPDSPRLLHTILTFLPLHTSGAPPPSLAFSRPSRLMPRSTLPYIFHRVGLKIEHVL